ncbi:hypothetical protein [Dyadobacter psychrotolerans]|uniref:Uncharacterized protein n=1 Tax=Dyadobacter psychrotolerans TaxID=2541721 RepID=A0A4R5DL65_9BACT|nr:hypothetical protein [Dyadobacter psychrotolerans]TDE14819.1 hypothetical protein E0F88_16685 [Dyadobacter psychrotolerans]
MKKICILMILMVGCNTKSCNMDNLAGTLGTFQPWGFAASEDQMNKAIANLYAQNPKYVIPEKWKYLDNWEESGYGFLQGKIFYFGQIPEEMYYVSYSSDHIDDMKVMAISVRAVTDGNDSMRWFKNDEIQESEQKRINNRFYEEIIKKLEKLLGVPAQKFNP